MSRSRTRIGKKVGVLDAPGQDMRFYDSVKSAALGEGIPYSTMLKWFAGGREYHWKFGKKFKLV